MRASNYHNEPQFLPKHRKHQPSHALPGTTTTTSLLDPARLTTLSHSTIVGHAYHPASSSAANKLEQVQTRFNKQIDRLIQFIGGGADEVGDEEIEDHRWMQRQRQAIEERVSRSKNRGGCA
jgi:hypothetical protein